MPGYLPLIWKTYNKSQTWTTLVFRMLSLLWSLVGHVWYPKWSSLLLDLCFFMVTYQCLMVEFVRSVPNFGGQNMWKPILTVVWIRLCWVNHTNMLKNSRNMQNNSQKSMAQWDTTGLLKTCELGNPCKKRSLIIPFVAGEIPFFLL